MEYDEQEETFSKPGVMEKYRAAAAVATKVMNKVIEECQAGKKVVDICTMADKLVTTELNRTVKAPSQEEIDSKDPEELEADSIKGVAFPTCISANNCAGHMSPLSDDPAVLKSGDIIKIDLGVHVGGYAAVLAHTCVVPGAADVTDKRADAVAAAYMAFQAVARSLRPGVKNSELSHTIETVAKSFGVSPVEGVLSHSVERFCIDGPRVIMNKPTTEQRVEEFEVEALQAFAIDVVMSTGEGRARETGAQRTTVYKHNPDAQYLLKLKASRATLAEIMRSFPAFPFTLRALGDEKRAKLGVAEMVTHGLLDPYPVLHERQGEVVAQFKGTFLVGPKGTAMLAGPPGVPQRLRSDKTDAAMAADDALRAALGRPLCTLDELAASLGAKKKSAKKKSAAMKRRKAAAAAAAAEPASAAAPASEQPQKPAPMDAAPAQQ